MRIPYLILCLSILLLLTAGCQDTTEIPPTEVSGLSTISPSMEKSFREIIQVENINEDVKLSLFVPQDGEVKINSRITLLVENISEKKLYFPLGRGIRFFTIQNSNWLELQNTTTYAGYPAFLLSNDPNNIQASTTAGGLPDFSNITNAEFLRVVVIGEELTAEGEKTGIPVVGMLDLAISP